MKRIIGSILLLLVFGLIIGGTCAAYGVREGLIAWAIAAGLTAIIVFAIWLVLSDL